MLFNCNTLSRSFLGVRIAAAESLPYLLECAKIRGPEYIANMWQFICPELLKAVDTEPESDIKSEHMHSLAQVGSHFLFLFMWNMSYAKNL